MGKQLEIKSIVMGVTILLIIYLMGCFISVSFDITKWDEGGRVMVGIFGPTLSTLIASLYYNVCKNTMGE